MAPIPLFEINPVLNRAAASEIFARDGRIQIRDILTDRAAAAIHHILTTQTPWGMAWQAGDDGPHHIRNNDLRALPSASMQQVHRQIGAAMRATDYAFQYMQYPMLDAYLQQWDTGSPQDLILEHINDQPFLDLVREVTGMADLVKADAQATLYAPNQFLACHDDSHVAEGWRVAYVMNFCALDWRPEWGGYLLFHDAEGDIVTGFRPRFNALNLFAVPQRHSVSYVPPFAPAGRFAITGWFRNR